MGDLLAGGAAWLRDRLQAVAASPVTYRRGSDQADVLATFGQTKLMLADESGAVRIEWTDRDFLVPRASLTLAGGPILPRRGDQVVVADADGTHTYEVLPYGTEPCWRWNDPFRQIVRVHTKLITAEAT